MGISREPARSNPFARPVSCAVVQSLPLWKGCRPCAAALPRTDEHHFNSTFQYASSTNCAHEACCMRINCVGDLSALGRRINRMPTCAAVLSALREFQRVQAQTRFSQLSAPPRERGMM
jgi:hypothetical protein